MANESSRWQFSDWLHEKRRKGTSASEFARWVRIGLAGETLLVSARAMCPGASVCGDAFRFLFPCDLARVLRVARWVGLLCPAVVTFGQRAEPPDPAAVADAARAEAPSVKRDFRPAY